MADSGFPLPSSSYKELIKIIQGYGLVGAQAASLSDVATATGINQTIVSANNKFLVAVGIVQGGKRKKITQFGAELAHALQHDIKEETAVKWRAIVDGNEFLQRVVAAVRIRKGMDESTLEGHVAYSAGQPKTPAIATGASAVVEILKTAGLLKDEAGNVVATTPETGAAPHPVEQSLEVSDALSISDSLRNFTSGSLTLPVSRKADGVQLNIEVRIQCTPKDLDGLGEKLRDLLFEFNQRPERTPAPAVEKTEDAK